MAYELTKVTVLLRDSTKLNKMWFGTNIYLKQYQRLQCMSLHGEFQFKYTLQNIVSDRVSSLQE